MRYAILILMICLSSTLSQAQNLKERGEVRRGNKEFVEEQFEAAQEHYTTALEYSPENFEARFNLGSALVKGGKVEDGERMLAELAADSLLCDLDRSNAFFNLGNSQFEQQKLEEALESYKDAMRLDPSDQEAKYNYAYTKALLEQQDQNEDQQDQDQDQDENENNEDQQQGDGDDEGNPEQQQQDQDDQEQDQDEQDQPQEQQPEPQPEPQISEQEQQQMLDAIQAQEDKTQEDLKERAQGVVVPGAKNW